MVDAMLVDALLAEALGGLLVEAVTRSSGPISRLVGRRRAGSLRAGKPTSSFDTTSLALSLLSELKDHKYPAQHITAMAKFLREPETLTFARQAAIIIIRNGLTERDKKLLIGQLKAMMALMLPLRPKDAALYAPIVGAVILAGIQEYLDALRNGPADERRHAEILATQEVQAGHLELLTAPAKVYAKRTPLLLDATYRFAQEYCSNVRAENKDITPPHLSDKQRVPIDKIYITQYFRRQKRGQRDSLGQSFESGPQVETVDVDQLLTDLYRLVIVGDPGAGKSTLAQKLAYDFSDTSTSGEASGSGQPICVPFVVILRDYSVHQRQNNSSVIQFIEAHSHSEYQLPPPAGAIEYLLMSGRALVIFDGLDELLETNRRQKITKSVEAFARRYPTAAILVTSRRIGYYEAPLDDSVFDLAVLAELNDTSIEQYVRKWFMLDSRVPKRKDELLAESFLAESESVGELRNNSLMLGLLCNVYRTVGFIPRTRAELYENCAKMLSSGGMQVGEFSLRYHLSLMRDLHYST